MWGPTLSQLPISDLDPQTLRELYEWGPTVGAYNVGAYSEPATDFGSGSTDTKEGYMNGGPQWGPTMWGP